MCSENGERWAALVHRAVRCAAFAAAAHVETGVDPAVLAKYKVQLAYTFPAHAAVVVARSGVFASACGYPAVFLAAGSQAKEAGLGWGRVLQGWWQPVTGLHSLHTLSSGNDLRDR